MALSIAKVRVREGSGAEGRGGQKNDEIKGW